MDTADLWVQRERGQPPLLAPDPRWLRRYIVRREAPEYGNPKRDPSAFQPFFLCASRGGIGPIPLRHSSAVQFQFDVRGHSMAVPLAHNRREDGIVGLGGKGES